MSSIPYVSGPDVREALPWDVAIEGVEAALRGGVDPEADGPRIFAPTPNGEFLIMPATATAGDFGKGLQDVQRLMGEAATELEIPRT